MGAIMPPASERYDAYSEDYISRMLMNRATLPATYDARQYNLISPVRNQKQCGSCADFSGVSVIETCLYKAGGLSEHVDLSEQWLLDCGYNGGYSKMR